MDKVQLQSCVENFKNRLHTLYRSSLSKELEDKYVKIYHDVLTAQSRTQAELFQLFKRVPLIGHVFKSSYPNGTTRFVFNKDERAFAKTTLCELANIQLDEDILPFGKRVPKHIELLEDVPDTLYKLTEISVYSTGRPTDNGFNAPTLTIQDILSQVPKKHVSKLIAFEVLNEESSYLDKFNVVMNMYCFNVVLYGNITD